MLFLLTLFIGCTSRSKEAKTDSLVLADASFAWWMAPTKLANENELYEKNNLDIQIFDAQTGLASMNHVISGTADVGFVATTPLANAAYAKENLLVLGSYLESNGLLSLTTKNLDTLTRPKPVEPIALVRGTISELYFYRYMEKYFPDLKIDNLNQLNLRPADVTNAMKNENANSSVMWEPFNSMIEMNNPNLTVINDSSLYTLRMYIVTKPETLKSKRSAIKKFMQTIDQSCKQLNAGQQSKDLTKKLYPSQHMSIDTYWTKANFSVQFDYSRMIELIIDESKTLAQLGYTPKDETGTSTPLDEERVSFYFDHDFRMNQENESQ